MGQDESTRHSTDLGSNPPPHPPCVDITDVNLSFLRFEGTPLTRVPMGSSEAFPPREGAWTSCGGWTLLLCLLVLLAN